MDRPATYWMLEPLRKYATFSGRARRAEYWWFTLFSFLLTFALAILDAVIFGADSIGVFSIIATLGLFLPGISVLVRRLHDRDMSGWWYWIVLVPLIGALYLFYQLVSRGTEGSNRYGPDSLTEDIATVFE
jgi:uncharacterized membrane protein YhaH (DUF805 family)